MKPILIILCLLLCGCQSAPKEISDRDILMIAVGQSLQTSMNIQAMKKSHEQLMQSLETKEVKKKPSITEEVFIVQQKLRERISELRIKYYDQPEILQVLDDVSRTIEKKRQLKLMN